MDANESKITTPHGSPTDEQMSVVYDAFTEMFQKLTRDPRMQTITPDIFAVLLLSQTVYAFNTCGVVMGPKLIGQASIADDPAKLARALLHQAGHRLEPNATR